MTQLPVREGWTTESFCMASDGELWTCPRCGRRFVGRTMRRLLGREVSRRPKEPGLAGSSMVWIAACGPYEVAPAKIRVAFMARVRFAGVNAISDRGMTIAFGLPRPMRHRRTRKGRENRPGW